MADDGLQQAALLVEPVFAALPPLHRVAEGEHRAGDVRQRPARACGQVLDLGQRRRAVGRPGQGHQRLHDHGRAPRHQAGHAQPGQGQSAREHEPDPGEAAQGRVEGVAQLSGAFARTLVHALDEVVDVLHQQAVAGLQGGLAREGLPRLHRHHVGGHGHAVAVVAEVGEQVVGLRDQRRAGDALGGQRVQADRDRIEAVDRLAVHRVERRLAHARRRRRLHRPLHVALHALQVFGDQGGLHQQPLLAFALVRVGGVFPLQGAERQYRQQPDEQAHHQGRHQHQQEDAGAAGRGHRRTCGHWPGGTLAR